MNNPFDTAYQRQGIVGHVAPVHAVEEAARRLAVNRDNARVRARRDGAAGWWRWVQAVAVEQRSKAGREWRPIWAALINLCDDALHLIDNPPIKDEDAE